MKGRFIEKMRNERGISVVNESSSDIPVTPPSMNSFGIRNPFSPKLAQKIPKTIRRILLIFSLTAEDIRCYGLAGPAILYDRIKVSS